MSIDQQPLASTMDRGSPGFLLNTQPIISILDYGGNTLQANPKPSGDTTPCRMTGVTLHA